MLAPNQIAVPASGRGMASLPVEFRAFCHDQETAGCHGDVEQYGVLIRLERIDSQVTLVVSQAGLAPLRGSVASGDLGKARIISIERLPRVSDVCAAV